MLLFHLTGEETEVSTSECAEQGPRLLEEGP